MLLTDANVLVYAHREDALDHARFREWLEATIESDSAYGVSEIVLSGFIRVVTHPRVFRDPSPLERALAFAGEIRDRPNAVNIAPGPRHWEIFTRFCREGGVKGNLVSDAYLAALAVESGCEWITTDRDFARFPGLEWRHPFGKVRWRHRPPVPIPYS
jgi:toxin-antitoxin system PIN domain toxin